MRGWRPDARPGNLAAVATATLCLLNGERADAGLAPAQENARSPAPRSSTPTPWSRNQYFEHDTPDGRDPVDRIRATGYIPTTGAGPSARTSPGAPARWPRPSIVSAWMNSPGHRANILRPEFREIGFGVVIGNPRSTMGPGATYTTNFGGITGAKVRSARAARNRRR